MSCVIKNEISLKKWKRKIQLKRLDKVCNGLYNTAHTKKYAYVSDIRVVVYNEYIIFA